MLKYAAGCGGIYNHYKRNFHDSRGEDDVELQKSNILMIGPPWARSLNVLLVDATA